MSRKNSRLQMQKRPPRMVVHEATDNQSLIIPSRIVASEVEQAIAETVALNNQAREHFETNILPFYDALRAVDREIAHIEGAITASGGQQTQKAVGEFADNLLAAMNAFERQVAIMSKNPLIQVNYESIQQLAKECAALRRAANAYATISEPSRRSEVQRKITAALAVAKPTIAKLFNPGRRNNEQLDLIAEMLIDSLNSDESKGYAGALDNLKRTYPTIYKQFFTHPTQLGREAYARDVVRGYNNRRV